MPLINRFFNDTNIIEAGVDEVGVGALSGPVVAAAVIWSDEISSEIYKEVNMINDSKKLTPKRRELLSTFIKEYALDWAIGEVDHQTIDRINILNARYLAVQRALDNLVLRPTHIILDGDKTNIYIDPISKNKIPIELIDKGDTKYQSIACASIIAKVHRDELMTKYHLQYPIYEWNDNKGYASQKHRDAINEHGISPLHRVSFGTCKKYVDKKTSIIINE
jgi:ribonuclease HII